MYEKDQLLVVSSELVTVGVALRRNGAVPKPNGHAVELPARKKQRNGYAAAGHRKTVRPPPP
jgi:hypothetical protein